MDKQVLNFESHTALFCGNEGIEVALDIVKYSPKVLKSGGRIYFELDPMRIELLRGNIQTFEFVKSMVVFKDMFGKNRFVCVTIF
jgi:release factor glutamine methyltransferase